MRISLVWFRNDLRLHDNRTLLQAIKESDLVVPVYIFDPHHYRTSTYGFAKTGPFRTKFLVESVAALRGKLRAAGSDLIVRHGDTAILINALCHQYGAHKVYCSQECAPEETSLENTLRQSLQTMNCSLLCCENSLLLDRDQLPFSVSGMPDVFTAFRWQVDQLATCLQPLAAPAFIPTPHIADAGEIPVPEKLFGVAATSDSRQVLHFEGGEPAGLQRLHDYVWVTDGPRSYFDTRNGLIGQAYSTKCSPWLANGCLSARQIYREIKRYERERVANKSTYWVIFELLWRDFFRLNMEKYHCELFFLKGPKRKQVLFTGNREQFERWRDGNTEDDFVNANMVELQRTGFMSNRGRQVVASYLVHDMNVSWLIGAAYFESMLIDYDVHSNYGNWAYVAGVGNDPRENRYFNTRKQAATYDPEGLYRKLWLASSSYER